MFIVIGVPARCRFFFSCFSVGWYLRVCATMSFTLFFSASFIIFLHCCVVSAIGFSTSMCFLCLAASIAIGACRLFGVAIMTASMSFLFNNWW